MIERFATTCVRFGPLIWLLAVLLPALPVAAAPLLSTIAPPIAAAVVRDWTTLLILPVLVYLVQAVHRGAVARSVLHAEIDAVAASLTETRLRIDLLTEEVRRRDELLWTVATGRGPVPDPEDLDV